MHVSTVVHTVAPLPFNPELAELHITKPYSTPGGDMFDVQVIMTEQIPDGCITHSRKHTYPAAYLALLTGIDTATLLPEVDWNGAAPLFAAFNVNIGPAPVTP